MTENTQTTTESEPNSNTAPRRKTKYKLKNEEARPSTGSLPPTQTRLLSQEKRKGVFYSVWPLLTARRHPGHPVYVIYLHPRDLSSQHHVTEILHCVMLSRRKQCNALVPMIGTETTYRYATQIW